MKSVNNIYWSYLQEFEASYVGSIRIPIKGIYTPIELIPDSYIFDLYGCTKEEFISMIEYEISLDYLGDIDDL